MSGDVQQAIDSCGGKENVEVAVLLKPATIINHRSVGLPVPISRAALPAADPAPSLPVSTQQEIVSACRYNVRIMFCISTIGWQQLILSGLRRELEYEPSIVVAVFHCS